MNATFQTNELTTAAKFVSKAVAQKSVRPVMMGIKIIFAKQGAVLCACNNDLHMTDSCKFEGDAKGEIVVPGEHFMRVIAAIKGDAVTMTIDDKTARITCDTGKFSIPMIDCDGFPSMAIGGDVVVSVTPAQIKDAIGKVKAAAAIGNESFGLQGIYFDFAAGNLVATDTHRLSVCGGFGGDATGEIQSVIVPTKNAIALELFVDSGCEEVLLSVNGNFLIAECGNTRLASCLVESKFPRYLEVLPEKGIHSLSGNCKEMATAIATAGISANETTNVVKIVFGDDDCTVSAISEGRGDSSVMMPCTASGACTIAFNYRYLLDALKACDDTCIMYFSDGTSPVLIESGNVIHVISPIYPKNA